MQAPIFELLDAAGGGGCRLAADGTIAAASPGFAALVGADVVGQTPEAAIANLPPIAELPATAGPVFRHVGADGIGRELAAAKVEGEAGVWLVLVDRSGEGRLRRSRARLDRQVDDLEARLAASQRGPKQPRMCDGDEIVRILDEAIARGHRYGHAVTVIAVRQAAAGPDSEAAAGLCLLGSIRGVDDVGHVDANHWLLVLPHTPLAGGEVVGRRIRARLDGDEVGLGIAQVGLDEASESATRRATQACEQALEGGGGLLLAVELV